MDEKLQAPAEQLAEEFAGSATTIGELNQLMRTMMKRPKRSVPALTPT